MKILWTDCFLFDRERILNGETRTHITISSQIFWAFRFRNQLKLFWIFAHLTSRCLEVASHHTTSLLHTISASRQEMQQQPNYRHRISVRKRRHVSRGERRGNSKSIESYYHDCENIVSIQLFRQHVMHTEACKS